MGVTRLLLLRPFYSIQTNFLYFFAHDCIWYELIICIYFFILGGMGGCEYKAERMKALADLIKSRSPYFDLFLLAELWMQADHQLLEEAAKSVGLHMTGFRQLASG